MQPHYVRSRDGEGEEKRDHYYYTVPTTVHVLLHTPPSPSPSGGVEWKRGGGCCAGGGDRIPSFSTLHVACFPRPSPHISCCTYNTSLCADGKKRSR